MNGNQMSLFDYFEQAQKKSNLKLVVPEKKIEIKVEQKIDFPVIDTGFSPIPTSSETHLRDYQLECIQKIEEAQERGHNRVLAALATGTGKTRISMSLFKRENQKSPTPALFIVHTDELVKQAKNSMIEVWPEVKDGIGIVKGDINEIGKLITITSVQTMHRLSRLEKAFPYPGKIRRLWTDESHHSSAKSYQKIYEYFNLLAKGVSGAPNHLGVTATPKRADGKGLDGIFDTIAYKLNIKDAIKRGILCNIEGRTLVFENEDIEDVGTTAGDFNLGELDKAVRKVARNEAIVEEWAKYYSDRKTMVFCTTVEHAHMVAATFDKYGYSVGVVDGAMKQELREKTLYEFKTGKTQIMVNCQVLTEGFDEPSVSCIVMARPTKSESLYIQIIGRGLRKFLGKKNCAVLDVADTAGKHSLMGKMTLIGTMGMKPKKDEEVIDLLAEFEQEEMEMEIERGKRELETAIHKDNKIWNPLDDPFEGTTGLRWVRGANGMLILPIPKEDKEDLFQHWIMIAPRSDMGYDLVQVTKTATENDYGRRSYSENQMFINNFPISDLEDAAWEGEEFAKGIAPKIEYVKGKNAKWKKRNDPASEKQINYLKILLHKHREEVPDDLESRPMHEISLMIDSESAKDMKLKISRSSNE